ncbi:hypothetical protein T4C_11069 [Trichinella pseudospiralis]|uniref:Uncharacterized protein n=1 Tax=Trichinella pseudospiralis TaxID=6337 RepID=A0A0V1HEZ2_TRIPS|nr:hypothetical protein T4C_11069 [Trichinella pseudospiralis]
MFWIEELLFLSTASYASVPRATPGAKVLKNSEILKNCPRHSPRRSLRAMPGALPQANF